MQIDRSNALKFAELYTAGDFIAAGFLAWSIARVDLSKSQTVMAQFDALGAVLKAMGVVPEQEELNPNA